MAVYNKTELKNRVDSNVVDNTSGAITGTVLNQQLTNVVDSLFTTVDTISSLRLYDTTNLNDGDKIQVTGYYSANDGSGDIYRWTSSESHANHDGARVINPNHLATSVGTEAWFLANGNSTPTTGSGCFVKIKQNDNKSNSFGINTSSSTGQNQRGIEKLANDYNVVEFGQGIYQTTAINTNLSNIHLKGLGMFDTILERNGADIINLDNSGSTVENLIIENIGFDMNGASGNGSRAIVIGTDQSQTVKNIIIKNCRFYNFNNSSDYHAIRIYGKPENLIIENNLFDFDVDSGHTAIEILMGTTGSGSDSQLLDDRTSSIIVKGNTQGGGKVFYRQSLSIGRGANVTIKDNACYDIKATEETHVLFCYHSGNANIQNNRFVNCSYTLESGATSDGAILWADVAGQYTEEGEFTERPHLLVVDNVIRNCTGNGIYVEDITGGVISNNKIYQLNARSSDTFTRNSLDSMSNPVSYTSDGGHGIVLGGGIKGAIVAHNIIHDVAGSSIMVNSGISAKTETDNILDVDIVFNKIREYGLHGIQIVEQNSYGRICNNTIIGTLSQGVNTTGSGIHLEQINDLYNITDLSIENNKIRNTVRGIYCDFETGADFVVGFNTFESCTNDIVWNEFSGDLYPNKQSNSTSINFSFNYTGNTVFSPASAGQIMNQSNLKFEEYDRLTNTTDGSGDIVVTHGLAAVPETVIVTADGTTPYIIQVTNRTDTTFTIRVFNTTGSAVTSTSVTFHYTAKMETGY